MARGLGKFINEIKRASEDIKTEINREADRIDREKKLDEYKKQVEKDLNIKKPDDKVDKETTEEIK